MKLPIAFPFAPMEAKIAAEIPSERGWQYEPKWDGFRCIALRDGQTVELQSKAGQSLTRYFPEIVVALSAVESRRFVPDGELIVPLDERLSFDDLLQRIHPAASRVKKLSETHPAEMVVFDLLADEKGTPVFEKPLAARRLLLEAFYDKYLRGNEKIVLSQVSRDEKIARNWLKEMRGQLDGIVAKKLDEPRLLRWRPDKDPHQCTLKQAQFESKVPFHRLLAS